jgi:hypothetical protein
MTRLLCITLIQGREKRFPARYVWFPRVRTNHVSSNDRSRRHIRGISIGGSASQVRVRDTIIPLPDSLRSAARRNQPIGVLRLATYLLKGVGMRSITGGLMLFVLVCSSEHAFGQRYGHIAQPPAMVNNYNATESSGAYCASCNAAVPSTHQYQGVVHQRTCGSPNPCGPHCCDPYYGRCLGKRCCFGRYFNRLCELERRKNQWIFGGRRACYNGGY